MPYEIDFISVGDSNGDAIAIRYRNAAGGYSIHLVDAGFSDTAGKIIAHFETYYGAPSWIDHLVLTHADRDHASGLLGILERYQVGTLWMNRPWLYAAETLSSFHGNYTEASLEWAIRKEYDILVRIEELAWSRGIPIREVFAGQAIGPFLVLSPTRQRYLELIPSLERTPPSHAVPYKGGFKAFTEALREARDWTEDWWNESLNEDPPAISVSNETSVVQLGLIDGRRLLLTADVGPRGLREAADVADTFGIGGRVDFMQIPHHGSRRNVTPWVLNRWLGPPVFNDIIRGQAFVSIGAEQYDYPRHRVKNAFLRRGFTVAHNRNGWIRHFHAMPQRWDEQALVGEAFSYRFRE